MKHGSGHWDALLNIIQSRGCDSDRPRQKSDGWIKDERVKADERYRHMPWEKDQDVFVFMFTAGDASSILYASVSCQAS